MLRRALTAFVLMLIIPLQAHAWWNADWTVRKKITLNTSSTGVEIASDQNFVPVLVRLHTGNFGFTDAKPDGADLRFVASDDKTPLKYHIETFDGTNELATVWVQIPKVTAKQSADYIWLYYGSDKASAGDDAKGTYDASFAAVYQFSERSGEPRDLTSNAVPLASSAAADKQGLIGGALRFVPGNQATAGPAPAFKALAAGGAAVSLWVQPSALAANQLVLQWGGTTGLTLGLANGVPYVSIAGATASASTPLAAGSWHHLGASVADRLVLTVDGVETATAAVKAIDLNGSATLGSEGASGFAGVIDEVEFSAVHRDSDWFKLAALGQASESKLLAFGQDEQAEAAGSSYFTILLKSVTLDGWVVISILMVMMVVSWVVMFTKTRFINQTRRGNQAFQARFATIAGNLLAVDSDTIPEPGQEIARSPRAISSDAGGPSDPALQYSSLYRLYHVGAREVKQRFDRMDRAGKERALTGPAIDAIRASLDAGMVRETQRLNSQLVLLTIAVSGGPFLGLLGTVVGVMITFAAIAAAGDVNVNAIAPGIAAALVATVAGLAVAIPALFGYNYLSIQVKNLTADMQVFNDELVTRFAENYSN